MARSGKHTARQGQLRIIGGQWRSRKLNFTPAEGLRPTSDRIRETLFNWLSASLDSSRCADLFAGSGALGLEALSRGAAHCDFVDTSRNTLSQIDKHLAVLDAGDHAGLFAGSAEAFLVGSPAPYDIVFIDPPFGQQLAAPVCTMLMQRQLLRPGAHVYIETAAAEPAATVPGGWELHREKTSGGVSYRLYRVGEARQ